MRPIVNMSEEDRATDTGNERRKFDKDRAWRRVVPEIYRQTERQTDRQTHRQTYSSQYFATVPLLF